MTSIEQGIQTYMPEPEELAVDLQLTQEFEPQKKDVVIIAGIAGANAEHMYSAIGNLAAEHPVYGTEYRVPEEKRDSMPIPMDRVFMTNTEEGQGQLDALLETGTVRSIYLSLVPKLHVSEIKKYLEYYGRGKLDFIVILKPAVSNTEERREVQAALWQAKVARKQWAAGTGVPEAVEPRTGDGEPLSSPLYVHEHYQEKEAWTATFAKLGEISERLGRLDDVEVSVLEEKTIESEHRELAFGSGALEDLGPHVLSLLLDVAYATNKAGRYILSNHPETLVQRLRYADTRLPDDSETGFVVRGNTEMQDRTQGTTHNLNFTLSGGKGTIDQKQIRLTFVRPETEERSEVIVDLGKNELTYVPDAISDLFPERKFIDNGYRNSVWRGLNGGDPDKSFQHWSQARIVIQWLQDLTKQGHENALLTYNRDISPADVIHKAGRTAIESA